MDGVVKNIVGEAVELDEYTAAYIGQVLVDWDDEDDPAEVRDMLCGLLETLVEDADVRPCVETLLASRDRLKETARLAGEGAQGISEGRLECGDKNDKDNDNDKENDKENDNSNSTSTSASFHDVTEPLGPDDDVVATLQSMFPGVDDRYLRRVYLWNDSNLEAAANDLLSKSEEEIADALEKMRLEEEAGGKRGGKGVGSLNALDESTKAAIKHSFMLEAVPGGGKQSRKNLRKNAAYLNAQVEKSKETKIRFRDGVVASTKGEKMIIENTKEEWNGGSSGKVYTKGKRGKGYVG